MDNESAEDMVEHAFFFTKLVMRSLGFWPLDPFYFSEARTTQQKITCVCFGQHQKSKKGNPSHVVGNPVVFHLLYTNNTWNGHLVYVHCE